MTRRRRPTQHLAGQAALRLRELFGAHADAPAPETHRARFVQRRPASSPAFQSHLDFELDGDVSARFQAALAVAFAQRVEQARAEPGSAFCMLAEQDLQPTLQWSLERPAHARIDIHTTGGARLWAVERLVRTCFEDAVAECTVSGAASARRLARVG